MNIKIMQNVCSLQLQTDDDKVFWLVEYSDHVETSYQWVEEPTVDFEQFEVALLPMALGYKFAQNPAQVDRTDNVPITAEDQCNVFEYTGNFARSYVGGKRAN